MHYPPWSYICCNFMNDRTRKDTHSHLHHRKQSEKVIFPESNCVEYYKTIPESVSFLYNFFFLFSLVTYSTQHIQNWKRTVSCACLQENAPLFQVCVYCYRNKTVPTKETLNDSWKWYDFFYVLCLHYTTLKLLRCILMSFAIETDWNKV